MSRSSSSSGAPAPEAAAPARAPTATAAAAPRAALGELTNMQTTARPEGAKQSTAVTRGTAASHGATRPVGEAAGRTLETTDAGNRAPEPVSRKRPNPVAAEESAVAKPLVDDAEEEAVVAEGKRARANTLEEEFDVGESRRATTSSSSSSSSAMALPSTATDPAGVVRAPAVGGAGVDLRSARLVPRSETGVSRRLPSSSSSSSSTSSSSSSSTSSSSSSPALAPVARPVRLARDWVEPTFLRAVPAGVTDIDAEGAPDPLMMAAYAPDMVENLRTVELRNMVSPRYLEERHADMNPGMRAILVDWLVEVAEEYRLMPETLYMAVQFIDRCLSLEPVSRSRLQLLGCVAMLVASKYEEIYPPSVDEFVYITDNTYTRDEILRMESVVLRLLGFNLQTASARTFMARFLRAAGATKGDMQTNLVKYLTELTLPEHRFLRFRPSHVCAAAILCARRTLHIAPEWTPTLAHYTGFAREELEACCEEIAQAHRDSAGSFLHAIREKYSHSPYLRVSITVAPLPYSPEVLAAHGGNPPPSRSSAANVTSNTY